MPTHRTTPTPLDPDAPRFPCVVKPRRGSGGVDVRFVESAADFVVGPDSLVQAVVDGPVEDVCVLCARGEPRAVLTQRRLRMRPASGGPGRHVVTTDRGELAEQAVALLRALQWHGPAQVEFKGGRLLDLNGRFWGTLALSVRAGMDFPLLACRLALDGDVAAPSGYRVGVHKRFWF